MVDWRGTILPVVSMRRRLHLSERSVAVDDRLIIARSSRARLALLVEEIVRVASISDGDIVAAEGHLAGNGEHSGGREDGSEIVLIHDLDAFLDEPEEIALETALGRRGERASMTEPFPGSPWPRFRTLSALGWV